MGTKNRFIESYENVLNGVSQSREMLGNRVRGYNVSTSAGRGHGSSEAGQNRQLKGDPPRHHQAIGSSEGWLGGGGSIFRAGGTSR